MNYLSHFVFNHEVRDLPCESYFALGVVLPDLWMRFSRKRRIRWKAVRAAEPTNAVGRNLRAGLLNHIEADRLFHTAPVFLRWQRELKERVGADDIHPALVDFLAHAMLELALDHHLLHEDESLLPRFFDVLAGCDAELAAQRVGGAGRGRYGWSRCSDQRVSGAALPAPLPHGSRAGGRRESHPRTGRDAAAAGRMVTQPGSSGGFPERAGGGLERPVY